MGDRSRGRFATPDSPDQDSSSQYFDAKSNHSSPPAFISPSKAMTDAFFNEDENLDEFIASLPSQPIDPIEQTTALAPELSLSQRRAALQASKQSTPQSCSSPSSQSSEQPTQPPSSPASSMPRAPVAYTGGGWPRTQSTQSTQGGGWIPQL